jgi:hypothetical protein
MSEVIVSRLRELQDNASLPLTRRTCGEAADEIDRLNRICKKQEATIQRYEDALMDGDDDET